MSHLWPWPRKMRGVEDCATVRDPRRRGRNGVERVESLGPVTLIELRTTARVRPTVRELAEGEIELRERECRSEGED